MLFDVPFIAYWSKIGEYRQKHKTGKWHPHRLGLPAQWQSTAA
jgi:hypothetical protein